MEFQRFADFPSAIHEPEKFNRHMAGIKAHWRSLGWEKIPKADEPGIKAAWIAKLESTPGIVEVRKPFCCWEHISTRELGDRSEELEAEFTLKILAAFRHCTRKGERLLAIDWQHAWYYFDPHGQISAATRDEWAMPVLPDIDSYNYVAPDFRFGVLTAYGKCWSLRMFGTDLLQAFAADPPELFLKVCGPGVAPPQNESFNLTPPAIKTRRDTTA